MAAAEPVFGSAPAAAAAGSSGVGAGAVGGGGANGAATVAAAVSGSVSAGGVATPGLAKVVLKVVLLGNSGVGKTCLLNRYVDGTYSGSGYKATIGSDFKLKEIVVDGQPVTLQIWDTAGQERFASLGDLYHRGANICLLVFDITKTDTFEALQQWKDEFLASSAMHGLEDAGAAAADFPFACIANKVDRHAERAVSQKRAAKWCSAGGSDMSYFETSAKDSTNVAQCFTSMTRRALKFMAESQVSVSKMMDRSANVVLEQRKRETAGCCS